jgi:hypothetical protein
VRKRRWVIINRRLQPPHHPLRRSPRIDRISFYITSQPTTNLLHFHPRGVQLTVSHKRRHNLIPHHIHNPWINLIQLPRIDREDLILDWPNIRLAILHRRTLPRLLTHIRPSPVPERADEIHHSALGADCWNCVLRSTLSLRVPEVAARNNARRTVSRRVRVKRGHYRSTEWPARTRGLDIAVVVVEVLGFLAGVDDNSVECADQVARVEKIVVQFQDARDGGEFVKDAGLVEERVDAVGVVAFEVVSASHGVWAAETVDFIACFGRFGGSEAVWKDNTA